MFSFFYVCTYTVHIPIIRGGGGLRTSKLSKCQALNNEYIREMKGGLPNAHYSIATMYSSGSPVQSFPMHFDFIDISLLIGLFFFGGGGGPKWIK